MSTWTRGKRGDWLVRSSVGLAGTVVTVSRRDGSTSEATLGRQIWTDGTVALYAMAMAAAATKRSNRSGSYRRGCPTDGNCSSFGSGKSCGAEDCDGWS